MSKARVVVSELEPDRKLYSQIIAREAHSLDMTPEEYETYTWVGMGVDTWIAYDMADEGVIIDAFGNWTYDPVKKVLYHKDPREKDIDLRVIQSAGDIFLVIEETYSFYPTVESEEFLDFYHAMHFAVEHTFGMTLGDLRGSQLTWTSDTMSEEK